VSEQDVVHSWFGGARAPGWELVEEPEPDYGFEEDLALERELDDYGEAGDRRQVARELVGDAEENAAAHREIEQIAAQRGIRSVDPQTVLSQSDQIKAFERTALRARGLSEYEISEELDTREHAEWLVGEVVEAQRAAAITRNVLGRDPALRRR
jgi:hypothetical protein